MKRIHTTYGFTMLPLILFLFVIVGLVSAGYMMLGPKVQLGKTVETKAGLEKSVDAIISWSVANGRLPDAVLPITSTTYFTNTIPAQTDSWGKPYIYLYDATLTNATTGGICGRTTTSYPTGCTNESTCNAFVLISGGDDYTVDSTPTTSQSFPATVTLDNKDLTRTVSLAELKNRAGCYGSTQGRLKILNNELPSVCDGSSTYSAKLVAEGGVSGATYTWSTQNAPDWLACDPSSTKACNDPLQTFTGQSLSLSVKSGKTASEKLDISFTLNDSVNPPVSRLLPIRKSTSSACTSSPPGGSSNFENIANDFTKTEGLVNNITINSDKTINLGSGVTSTGSSGYGCIWDKTNKILAGYTLRSYFEFKTNVDTSSASSTYGDGFTFAIMQGANSTTACGGAGEALGYGDRIPHSIPGNSFAIEFDTFPNSAQNDPTNYDHIAVVTNGSVKHNTTTNPTCSTSTPTGCYYRAPISWMEDGATHKVRIEVATQCNATCSSCGSITTSAGYALINAWIDCTDASCSSLLTNYSAQAPSITHCMALPSSMDNVKIGFTEASWGANQSTIISNFAAGFY